MAARLILCALFAALCGEAVERYELPLVGTPPVIDGDLSDPAWRRAIVLDRFRELGGREPAAGERVETRAYLTADRANLYVAVYCGEPFMDRLTVRHTRRDSEVWKDDDVELMIVPCDADGDRYVQLAVNAAGVLMDACLPAAGAALDLSYDSHAEIRTRKAADAWTVELRLPLASLPIESVQGPWRFHIARSRRTRGVNLTSLRTPVSGFHDLSAFAELTGIEKLRLPLGLREFSFGKLTYGGNMCTFGVAGNKDVLDSAAIEVDGTPRALFDRAALQIMSGVLQLPFHLSPEDRGGVLALKVYQGEVLLQSRTAVLNTLPEQLLGGIGREVHLFYPNRCVELEVPVNMVGSAEHPLSLLWQASNAAGNIVGTGRTRPSGQRATVRLYWNPWRPGRYEIALRLVSDGAELARRTQTIRLFQNPWQRLE